MKLTKEQSNTILNLVALYIFIVCVLFYALVYEALDREYQKKHKDEQKTEQKEKKPYEPIFDVVW